MIQILEFLLLDPDFLNAFARPKPVFRHSSVPEIPELCLNKGAEISRGSMDELIYPMEFPVKLDYHPNTKVSGCCHKIIKIE